MESVGVSDNSIGMAENSECSCSDEAVQFNTSGIQENENLGFLNEFELYWEDIKDRLIVSRVVTDSVIKGVVNAVSQEANDRIAAKELEMDGLNEVLSEWQMTQQLQEELYHFMIQSTIHSLREDNKRRVIKTESYGGKSIRWREKLEEILSDLDVVQKSLSSLEQYSSHGSLELDHFHRKVSPCSSVWENGGSEQCELCLPEKFESSNLNHMKIEELYNYFRDQITNMKRGHESTIQLMTEDYFGLKRDFLKERELLKERGSFSPSKSKDFSILKKTIDATSLKLNNIVWEDANSSETHDSLSEKLDNLLAENSQLRNMLNGRIKKVKHRHSLVSHTEQRLAKQSLDEKNLCRMVENLTSSVEDSLIEASVNEEVYKTIIRELVCQTGLDDEENKIRSFILQDILTILYEEAIQDAGAALGSKSADASVSETIMMQEISGLVFQEILIDMEKEMKRLMTKCLGKDQLIVSLQSKVSNMEAALGLEGEEKKKSRNVISELHALVEARDKTLMDLTRNHNALIRQKNNELERLKADLEKAIGQINLYKDKRDELTKTIELLQQESKRSLLLADTKYRKCWEETKSAVHLIQRLSEALADFEHKTTERIKWNNLRLENSTFQLESLSKKANVLRRTGLLYKQRLERRCSDLQKAEAEVDLLGDEVDVLLSLLEKIYIALDHYSPILQHYPGIMEILKLVRRELSGDATKSFCTTP